MSRTVSDFGRVAVLMGGQSAEREISLLSGGAVLEALLRQGVDACGVDAGPDVLEQLAREGVERVFIVLHGRGGEDGVIQGGLEIIGLPYTGSGVASSALGMDKYRCKVLWGGLGLPTPPFRLVESAGQLPAAAEALGFPLIVKPVREGSSFGMARVESSGELHDAWEVAVAFDPQVLLERWIEGSEFTAAVLGGEALPLIRLETPHTFYDYDAKYKVDTTRYICPCGLEEEMELELRGLALNAFDAVGASGWGRVDLMMDEGGQPWLIEVNTVPGMTAHSLVPMAAQAVGIEFDSLVWRILESSL